MIKTFLVLQTARDTLEISVAPVIFSHSSAQALCNSARNVPDQLLQLTVLLIQMPIFGRSSSLYSFFAGGQEGPGDDQLLLLLHNLFKCFIYNRCDRWAKLNIKKWWFDFWLSAHINHVREVAGIDSVGIGASYDGINAWVSTLLSGETLCQLKACLLLNRVPEGLEDVSKYANLFSSLYGSGNWTLLDLKKLAGLNFLRVWREVEKVKDFKASKSVSLIGP